MNRKYVLAVLALAGLCFASLNWVQAQAPAPTGISRPTGVGGQFAPSLFYVKATGKKTGAFKGDSMRAGHQGSIEGIKFAYQMTTPTDAATGMPAGRRQYSAITFTKPWSPASPEFIESWSTNESLTNVTFEFVTVGLDGKEVPYQTITLTNATVSAIKRHMGVSTGMEPPDPRELEDISFNFQTIEVYDAAAKTTASDNWVARQ
jgi:type VI secretion system Hcp family effector